MIHDIFLTLSKIEVNLEACCFKPLLKRKVISLCHEYRARPVCISLQLDQALHSWLIYYKFLDILKLDNMTRSSHRLSNPRRKKKTYHIKFKSILGVNSEGERLKIEKKNIHLDILRW